MVADLAVLGVDLVRYRVHPLYPSRNQRSGHDSAQRSNCCLHLELAGLLKRSSHFRSLESFSVNAAEMRRGQGLVQHMTFSLAKFVWVRKAFSLSAPHLTFSRSARRSLCSNEMKLKCKKSRPSTDLLRNLLPFKVVHMASFFARARNNYDE